ncbi:MAG: hypothetical protein QNL43_04260 [Crocinitomicaceae bacterium]|jgi:hypothetical protein|tara:strand:+ start:31111 stop:32592 length:1482 start_codon:yes stop_codon:yes gene_type:complete
MIINKALTILVVLLAFGAWNQSDIGYLNGSLVTTLRSEAPKDSSSVSVSLHHSDLRPSLRLNNSSLGFRLSKKEPEKINLIPLIDLGIQYNDELSHRGGLGFLLEARPIKKSYVRIGGLVNVSNSALLNPGNINLSELGTSQELWFLPLTRLAYTPNEVFSFQVGYDKNFIGAGRRSLFLSDYGKPMPFGQIRAQFWHMEYSVNYQFLSENYNGQKRSKYVTSHYLSWDILPWLNLGIFEAVVFQPKDTLLNRGYDVEYLNPFVFYRPQEYSMGSSDNVVIGAALKASIKNTIIYAQVVLDEFLLSEIRARSGWWANKFGFQLGVSGFFDLGLSWLSYRIESNLVRPYTFSHLTPLQVYGNNGSPLAHPYGSNFSEILIELNWRKRINGKLKLSFFGSYGIQGVDINGLNYGSDIYQPYINRPNDYGNFIGQGIQQNFLRTNTRASYNISQKGYLHAFVELQTQYLKIDEFRGLRVIPMVGLRSYLWNDYRNY